MSSKTNTATERRESAMLDIDSLNVEFAVKGGKIRALRDVSMSLQKGETIGIVGESGSGKSTLALAIVRYLDNNATISTGQIRFKGRDIYEMSKRELQEIRGNEIAHVAQNASRALNPSLRVGYQIKEAIELHQDVASDDIAMDRVYDVLDQVNISNPPEFTQRFPHELSGGQQQRVLIAIGLSCNPDFLILDEPTTGLDVTTQAKLLDLIEDLKAKSNVGIMFITHDLAVVSRIADRVNILYAGEMMEQGTVEDVFNKPANPYTQALLATTPALGENRNLRPIRGQIPELQNIPEGCIFADRCEFETQECRSENIPMTSVSEGHETRCIRWETATENPVQAEYGERRSWSPGDHILEAKNLVKHYDEGTLIQKLIGNHQPVKALRGVSLSIAEGETVGLVGESGCGKSTFGHTLLHLTQPTSGTIRYRGRDLTELSKSEMKDFRSECQIIFQDPEASLNPRIKIKDVIKRPLQMFTDFNEKEQLTRVKELLDQVNLSLELMDKYPHELSGGQQQRVAIARAFATNPSLVILDEPVSSLDVSVQASILNLLNDLQDEYKTSYLLISHDMGVIEAVSDRLAVMYLGLIVEKGRLREVFDPPFHPYTRSLLSAIPSLNPNVEDNPLHLKGDVPSARDPPSGCTFHTRCPQKIGDICETNEPELEEADSSLNEKQIEISCHLDDSEMAKPVDTEIDEL